MLKTNDKRSGEMEMGLLNALKSFWGTYVVSYEGIATIVIVLIMLLKVLINQKASALNFKKMLVAFPGELVFLVMGFLLSDMISSTSTGTSENNLVASIIIALIILVIQYALERWLDDKLSGKLAVGIMILIVIMYAVAIGFYIGIIFGGAYNG